MSKISTYDCKQFLASLFENTSEKEWKRTRKCKNEQGLWIRDFEHSHEGTISLIEADGVLSIHSNQAPPNKPQTKPISTFEKRIFNSKDIKTVKRMFKTEIEPDESWDEQLANVEDFPNSKNGLKAIPGVVLWCIPLDIWKNSEFDTKSINLSSNMKDATLIFFDKQFEYEYSVDFMKDNFIPNYLESDGDSLFLVNSDITLETIVRDLSLAGFTYKNTSLNGEHGDGCIIKKVMKNVTFTPVDDMILQQRVEHGMLKDQATSNPQDTSKSASLNN